MVSANSGARARARRSIVVGAALALLVAGSVGTVATAGPPREATQQGVEQVDQQQSDCDYERLYESVDGSVATVHVSTPDGSFAEGSGWVYAVANSTAYVVTNWHVVYNASDYDVQFADGEWREAALVGASSWTDLAVLRVEDVPEATTALRVARRPARRGQAVAVVGNPFGLEGSVSEGVVSGVDRATTVRQPDGLNRTVPDTVQTTAASNPGNSGGPLVNCRGRVQGVIFAGEGPIDSGVNFALSPRMVRTVVPALVQRGTFPTPSLGIQAAPVNPTLAEVNNLSVSRGVMVTGVLPGGPADGALRGAPAVHLPSGLPYDGDVVLAVDGERVADENDLLSYLFLQTRPGQTVNLTVSRDGENRTVPVTLEARPEVPVQQPGPRTPVPTPPTPTPPAPTTPTVAPEPARPGA